MPYTSATRMPQSKCKPIMKARTYVELEAGGKWMFKVMHRDPEKSAQDRYDEKVMTATFTVMNIR